MLKFTPARFDHKTFKDAQLDPVNGLVQSLRWFASRTSLLIGHHAYHQVIRAENEAHATTRPLPSDAFYMLDRAFYFNSILEIRALVDRDPNSLGVVQIAKGLGETQTRAGLLEYLDKYPPVRATKDQQEREAYLDYIAKYCKILGAPERELDINGHPLLAKLALVRRLANKALAHSTLDDYILGGSDLGDVVLAIMIVACAIEAVMGDAACSNDLAICERISFRGAGLLLHVQVDEEPHNVNMIRAFLPSWISTGLEFPLYPDEFEAHGRALTEKRRTNPQIFPQEKE